MPKRTAAAARVAKAVRSQQPNVLLIIADDYGAEAASLYPSLAGDSGAVPVPNIEALAKNGLVFDNAWASPACSMTRGTIVSGLYGYRTGVTSVGAVLPTDTVTLFDRITAESPSYAQAFFGKYHLGGGQRSIRARACAFADSPKILQHVRDIGVTNFHGILGGAARPITSAGTFTTATGRRCRPRPTRRPRSRTWPSTTSTMQRADAAERAVVHVPGVQRAARRQRWRTVRIEVPPPELHSVDLSSVGNPKPGT